MTIPLLDLKAQYRTIQDDVLAAVREVLESQICIGGPKVAELEERVAAISDCRFGVAVSSGTDALLCSLMALGIGPGDEVITAPYTFFATAGSIVRAGARPVFVDIDPCTFNLDAGKIEAAVTPKTKAVIPVHLYGQMCDMDAIMAVAARHGLYVIEDAAQAISASYKGRKAGSIGTLGCFSFFPSKNLGGAGDGGMVVTNDARLYDTLMILRNHGMKPKYYHKFVGANFRLDALQAAVLLVKLPHLEAWSAARRRNAAYYTSRFAGTDVVPPSIRPECVSIFNQYVIRVKGRDSMMARLKSQGISTEIYYPVPLHRQECFSALGYGPEDFPASTAAAAETLALPIYPELMPDQLQYVADAILSRPE